MRSTLAFLTLCVVLSVSCEDRSLAISAETQLAIDLEKIDTYLAENGITAQTHPSGLRFVVHQMGAGDRPGPDKCVQVNIKMWLLGEPELFDEYTDLRTPLPSTILGWRIGMKEIQKGGSISLYVPSGLAYGPSGDRRNPDKIVPKNQVLIFDVDLTNLATYNIAGNYCTAWQ